jgi:hypothetical protein
MTEKHGETGAANKSRNQPQSQCLVSLKGTEKGKLKTQSEGKSDSPGKRPAVLLQNELTPPRGFG